jgi:2-dehydropantoate 2-reductase
MRFLVVGAGAVGGYFGGRLLEAGRDVTFLVRPERAARLAQTGLAIRSPLGDAVLKAPTVLAADLRDSFDVVLLSCKAYDLDGAIASFAPAVGATTTVIPFLNGMRHLATLDARLGGAHVLGGVAMISANLDAAGRILDHNAAHRIIFGERAGGVSPRVEAIGAAMQGATFEAWTSADIVLEMWEKWVMLASLAAGTCLTRAAIGDIVGAGGADLMLGLIDECREIAAAAGRAPRPDVLEATRRRLTDPPSTVVASMLGDVERRGPTEADHVLGDLLARRPNVQTPDRSLLRIAYTALKATAARVAREQAGQTDGRARP